MTIEIKAIHISGAKKIIVDKESIISLKYLRDVVVKCYDISNISAMKLSYLEGEEWYHLEKDEEVQQVIEKHLHIYVWDECLSAHFPDIKVNILKYDRRSTKPFATYIMPLDSGRKFNLRHLLSTINMHVLIQDSNKEDILIAENDDGKSAKAWMPGGEYTFRAKAEDTIARKHEFSSKMDIFQVYSDFGIVKEESLWLPDIKSIIVLPSNYIVSLIELYGSYDTMRVERSRRFLVTLLMLHALEIVDSKTGTLCIDEETPLNIVKTVINSDGKAENVQYNGKLDLVIGHSKDGMNMPSDASLLVVEVKAESTFNTSYAQTLSEAASLMHIRKLEKRGKNGSGGPIFMIQTDGERWKFSQLYEEDDGDGDRLLKVQYSDVYSLQIKGEGIEDTAIRIISWLVYLIGLSKTSSPRVIAKMNTCNNNVEHRKSIFGQTTTETTLNI